jgi:hypothetical protein
LKSIIKYDNVGGKKIPVLSIEKMDMTDEQYKKEVGFSRRATIHQESSRV